MVAEPGSAVLFLHCVAARAVRTWKYGTFFTSLYLALLLCLGVACGIDSSGDERLSLTRNAWLGSGFIFCISPSLL